MRRYLVKIELDRMSSCVGGGLVFNLSDELQGGGTGNSRALLSLSRTSTQSIFIHCVSPCLCRTNGKDALHNTMGNFSQIF